MACPTHGPLLDAIDWSGGTAALAALGYAFGLCRNWLEAGESGSGGGATLPIGELLAKNKLGGWTLASRICLGQQLASPGFGLLNMLASSGFGVLGMVAKGSYSGDFAGSNGISMGGSCSSLMGSLAW